MHTNIDIDVRWMNEVHAAGPHKTQGEVVEAGLMLLRRHAAMRELLKMDGAVAWRRGDEGRLLGQRNSLKETSS